ncbi:MalY/PatB family protein [Sutcliffiella rhizosphaerae]|uniref:cysteine-S-conjugate beta-lyase n=1 Tax=Sutcliffiella rhizosphaerae TaxID=2880967 RepID=A0ABM8YM13_9BACI|nr:MalY/PatB family protein [Sutcliffiella rhizosphaerae]CAG9620995.1 Cystathionine beta-lyase PatB [Sutcliffiella rhizosphaerae]
MQKHNFDLYVERQNTSSVKWDERKRIFGTEDVLPMWVADMDFQAPPEVVKAIKEKAEHGIFGYTSIPTSVSQSIITWYQKRHKWKINAEWFTYISGVVPAISASIQVFSNPGDKIALFSPVYYPFYGMVTDNDRTLVTIPLFENNGQFEMDFKLLESQLDSNVRMLLLCNPHNPGGNVWKKSVLEKLAEICVKHQIIVVADEIHGDLIFKEHAYTPFASISQEIADLTITCIAPTKTFNLAGLQASVMITSSQSMKAELELFMKRQGHFTLNLFGITAMESAYIHGESWLDEVLDYLENNMDTAIDFIQKNIPKVFAHKPEGTYLLWIDCRKLGLSDSELKRLLLQKGKLALEPGNKFGPGGEGFVRMNVACSKGVLEEGLKRLKAAFE